MIARCLTCLILLLAAPMALARGEVFPDNCLAYAEVTGGTDLMGFLDMSGLPIPEEGRERKLIDEGLKLVNTLERAEVALVDVTADGNMPVIVGAALHFNQAASIDLLKPFGLPVEQLPTEDYGSVKIYKPANDGSAGGFAFIGQKAYVATRLSTLKSMLDAVAGKADADHLLPSNPRFQQWEALAQTRIVRVFVNGPAVRNTFMQFSGMGEIPREVMEVGEWLGWNQLNYGDLWFGGEEFGLDVHFTEGPSWLKALPAPGPLNTLKYLPDSTVWFVSGHAGEAEPALGRALAWMQDAQQRVAEMRKGGEPLARDMFDNRFKQPERLMDDFIENAAGSGYRLAAIQLHKRGIAMPWSGKVADLAKVVEMSCLNTALLGYAPDEVKSLSCDYEQCEFTGTIIYRAADGASGELTLGHNTAHFKMSERAMPLARKDGLPGVPPHEYVKAMTDAISMAIGMTPLEASNMLGTDVTFGFGLDDLRLRTGGNFDRWDDKDFFFAVSVRQPAVLRKRALAVFDSMSKAREGIVKRAKDGSLEFKHLREIDGVDVLNIDGTCIALTRDALLVAPPGMMLRMLSGKRPDTLTSFGATAGARATAMLGWNTAEMNPYRIADLQVMSDETIMEAPASGIVTLTANADSISVAGRQSMRTISELAMPYLSLARYSWDEGEGRTLAELASKAREIHTVRSADADPDNDAWPTLAEMLGANDGPSYAFKGRMLTECWELLPQPAGDAVNPMGAIAISSPLKHERYLIVTNMGETKSISPALAKKLRGVINDPSTAKANDFTLPRLVSLSKKEAELWLESRWNKAIRDLAGYGGFGGVKKLKVGDTLFFDEYGDVEILSVSEEGIAVRVTGFGHWADFDSVLGMTSASWDMEKK